MNKIANTLKRTFTAYCENSYNMNKAAFDAGLPLM